MSLNKRATNDTNKHELRGNKQKVSIVLISANSWNQWLGLLDFSVWLLPYQPFRFIFRVFSVFRGHVFDYALCIMHLAYLIQTGRYRESIRWSA